MVEDRLGNMLKYSDMESYNVHTDTLIRQKGGFISTAPFPSSGSGSEIRDLSAGVLEIGEVKRLGLYLSFLRLMRLKGRVDLSLESIAAETDLRQSVVEEDLIKHGLMLSGQKAFHIITLMNAIEQILGYRNETESFLVGAGKLGTSLLMQENLGQTCLKIVAAFDTDFRKIGSRIGSIRVMSPDKIIPLAARMHVSLGIIATPAAEAAHVANLLAGAGMKAIWNFTAGEIDPGQDIIVEQTLPGDDIALAYENIVNRLRNSPFN